MGRRRTFRIVTPSLLVCCKYGAVGARIVVRFRVSNQAFPSPSLLSVSRSGCAMLWQESLGGNSRTSLVVNCSPALLNRDETMSTLRFGVRAKRMVNNPRANKERSAAELKLLLEQREQEIARLKKRVALLEGA
jgi:hypothetical protein